MRAQLAHVGRDAARRRGDELGLDRRLDDGPVDEVHARRARPRARRHDALERHVAEEQPDAVVGHPPRRQRPVGHRAPGRRRAAPGSVSAWTDSEPGSRPRPGVGCGRARRRRHAALQPAHRPGAEPGEHDAALPRVAQHPVEPVDLPDGEQVAHRAAADVDDVLGEDDVAQRPAQVAHAEEREHLGLARPIAEGGVEAPDLVARVAAGRGQEEDPRHRARRRAAGRARRARGRPAWR